MEVSTLVVSFKMRSQVLESTSGQMARPMKENGKRIKCMAEVILSGEMESATKASLRTTCATVMAASNGEMAAYMKVPGSKENSTGLDCSRIQTAYNVGANGTTARR